MEERTDLWYVAAGVSNPSNLGTAPVQQARVTSAATLEEPGARSRTDAFRSESDAPRPKSKPVLMVVDDEPNVLQSMQDLLRMDYEVHTFRHGAVALEFLRGAPRVHVILSDQRMQGMNGVEVLGEAMAIRPETTRLLFTAYSDLHAVVEAINRGNVFRYIAKPCDPEFLSAIVRQAVEHHELIVEKNSLLRELQESNAKLSEANRVKGAFIEVASHELNTPLTVVLGMIDLWKMSQSETASPAERQWVDRIGAAAGRLREPSIACSNSSGIETSASRSASRRSSSTQSPAASSTNFRPTSHSGGRLSLYRSIRNSARSRSTRARSPTS